MATTSKTQRPSTIMKATVNELVAINFLVPPDILKPLVPKGLELSYLGDETYVSVVCNTIRKAGLFGLPFSGSVTHMALQFYVRRTADPLSRKGICKFKNFVSGSDGGWAAKLELETKKLKMKRNNSGFKSQLTIPEVEYHWKVEENWNKLRIKARDRIKNLGPKTRAGFILEHKNLYHSVRGKTLQFEVEQSEWTAWDAAHANFTCDVQQLFGKDFVKPLARRPASVFVSNGGNVEYLKPQQIA